MDISSFRITEELKKEVLTAEAEKNALSEWFSQLLLTLLYFYSSHQRGCNSVALLILYFLIDFLMAFDCLTPAKVLRLWIHTIYGFAKNHPYGKVKSLGIFS